MRFYKLSISVFKIIGTLVTSEIGMEKHDLSKLFCFCQVPDLVCSPRPNQRVQPRTRNKPLPRWHTAYGGAVDSARSHAPTFVFVFYSVWRRRLRGSTFKQNLNHQKKCSKYNFHRGPFGMLGFHQHENWVGPDRVRFDEHLLDRVD